MSYADLRFFEEHENNFVPFFLEQIAGHDDVQIKCMVDGKEFIDDLVRYIYKRYFNPFNKYGHQIIFDDNDPLSDCFNRIITNRKIMESAGSYTRRLFTEFYRERMEALGRERDDIRKNAHSFERVAARSSIEITSKDVEALRADRLASLEKFHKRFAHIEDYLQIRKNARIRNGSTNELVRFFRASLDPDDEVVVYCFYNGTPVFTRFDSFDVNTFEKNDNNSNNQHYNFIQLNKDIHGNREVFCSMPELYLAKREKCKPLDMTEENFFLNSHAYMCKSFSIIDDSIIIHELVVGKINARRISTEFRLNTSDFDCIFYVMHTNEEEVTGKVINIHSGGAAVVFSDNDCNIMNRRYAVGGSVRYRIEFEGTETPFYTSTVVSKEMSDCNNPSISPNGMMSFSFGDFGNRLRDFTNILSEIKQAINREMLFRTNSGSVAGIQCGPMTRRAR
ncbi:MAG: hypothetical protein HQL07_12150 [Nitrospirae bacterium]|nr:hypothetical protein [Magnetococcales bacterium]HAT51050.1 hypothetical protein [Alphaproteobacteria bacterium]